MSRLLFGLLLSVSLVQPLADLHGLAAELSRDGVQAQVGRSEDGGERWEIWYEARGPVTDAALKSATGRGEIGAIRLLAGGFGDAGVAHLRDLRNLHTLVLISDRLTDACTEPVSRLSGLVKLDLNQARLTRVGLSRLARLPKLRRLYLYNARIADDDLAELARFKRLTVLRLPAEASDERMASLRKAIPGAQLSR